MTNSIIYIREIVQGLISALSKKEIDRLYAEHKKEIAEYNHKHRKTEFKKSPCSSLLLFKSTILPAVIVLKLQKSVFANYLSNLTYNEIAFILGKSTSKEAVVQLENRIVRVMKHPRNKKVMEDIKNTVKEIDYPQETLLSIF